MSKTITFCFNTLTKSYEMKTVCLLILALVLVYATNGERICDIDSNGKPECTELNVNHTFRNFWDATHYWYCANLNEEPQSIRCPSGTLYDESTEECIPWKHWEWTNPCPDNDE